MPEVHIQRTYKENDRPPCQCPRCSKSSCGVSVAGTINGIIMLLIAVYGVYRLFAD